MKIDGFFDTPFKLFMFFITYQKHTTQRLRKSLKDPRHTTIQLHHGSLNWKKVIRRPEEASRMRCNTVAIKIVSPDDQNPIIDLLFDDTWMIDNIQICHNFHFFLGGGKILKGRGMGCV